MVLAAAVAALAELVAHRLVPAGRREAFWPAPEHAAYWATFAASVPLVARACEATRGMWRLVLVGLFGAYLSPIACVMVAGQVASLVDGTFGGVAQWAVAGEALVNLATRWPPVITWWFGHPAAFLFVYLLESGLTPRAPAAVLAVVAYVVQAIAYIVAAMAVYGQRDVLRYFAWSGALWEGAWPALAVLSASLATLGEARLAVWLTARREERARRG